MSWGRILLAAGVAAVIAGSTTAILALAGDPEPPAAVLGADPKAERHVEGSSMASGSGSSHGAAPGPLAPWRSPPDPTQVVAYEECPPFPIMEPARENRHSFYFTRGAYTGTGFRNAAWRTDFEKADRQFLVVLERIMDIDNFPCENPVRLDDPALRRFPFLYMVEVGYMGLTQPEVEGLRGYLEAGGFLLVDDFWGTREWANFEREIRRVLPDHQIVEIPEDHLVFRIAYPVEEVLQVPSINNARRGVYHEQDGYDAYMRGIFDDDGRLMVGIAWNTDLGDAWEWAEQPDYPWDRSNYAFQMGINFIVYAMTH